jgi:hypothetical protein
MDLNHMRNAIDAKEYRLIKVFGSNLDCVLISTKEKNVKAAAAMAVQVGSFADPFVAGMYMHIPFCFYIRSFLKLRLLSLLFHLAMQRAAHIFWRYSTIMHFFLCVIKLFQ